VETKVCASEGRLEIHIKTPEARADLDVVADLTAACDEPPPGSPFTGLRQARQFAGPLPFTFDYENETHSIVLIEGVRKNWKPRPVQVNVLNASFLKNGPFRVATPVLANAFYVADIPYEWKRGRRENLALV
jgi:hypothetical protein